MTEYTIKYNTNGGTKASGAPTEETTSYHSAIITHLEPTYGSKRFVGWATSSTASVATYLPGSAYSFTQDITLYAVWANSNTFVVHWVDEFGNGGTLSFAGNAVTKGAALKSSDFPVFTAFEGCYFDAWVYYPDDDEQWGTQVVTVGDILTRDRTIRARTYPFSVSFNANGGTNAPSSKNVDKKTAMLTLPTQTPTAPNGKVFLGWHTDKNATAAGYMAGGTHQFTANTILYAIYGIPNYVLTFDPGEGVITTSNTLEVEQGSSVKASNLIPPIPVRDGYYFAGWYTSSGVRFDVNTVYDESITFYAKWINGVLWDYLPIVVDGKPTAMKPYIVADGEWVPIGPKVYTASEWKSTGCPASLSSEPSVVYVSVPSQVNTLTYDGNEQSPTFNENDDYVLVMTEPEINAGTYSATCALIPSQDDDVVVKWADGTTEDKTVAWTINKAQGAISVPANDGYNLEVGTPFEVEVESNVSITATVEPSSIADVEVTEVEE